MDRRIRFLKKLFFRILVNIFTLFIIISISYAIMKVAPGSPFEQERALTPEVLAELKLKYEFTYWEYVSGIVFRGDFRYSYSHRNLEVMEIIGQALPVSLELGFYALGLAVLMGLLWGVSSALVQGRWYQALILAVAMLGIAIPNFVLGTLLQLVFALKLQWTRVAGWQDPAGKILPVITLSLSYIAYITRISRGSFLENLGRDYVRTARAKGLGMGRILVRHVLRNSLLPVVNYLAPATAAILTGTLVVEKIFNIPGMGRYFVESVFQRDYPLALGVIIIYSLFLLFLNLLADVLQTLIDPRIELQ